MPCACAAHPCHPALCFAAVVKTGAVPHRTRAPVCRPHRILAQIAYAVPALAPHARATPALYFAAVVKTGAVPHRTRAPRRPRAAHPCHPRALLCGVPMPSARRTPVPPPRFTLRRAYAVRLRRTPVPPRALLCGGRKNRCRTAPARPCAACTAYSRKSPMPYLRSRRTPVPARRHEEARIVSAGKKQPQYAANRRFI